MVGFTEAAGRMREDPRAYGGLKFAKRVHEIVYGGAKWDWRGSEGL